MTTPYDASRGPVDPRADEAYLRWRQLQEQADAERDALLVSDAERDQVCRRLATAFSEGRITSPELDERTSRALASRTYGDLDDVMVGLEPPATPAYRPVVPGYPPPRRSVVPRLVFWLVGLITAPFILAGTILTLSGESVFGVVLLLLFLPGLIALYRWAHPRT